MQDEPEPRSEPGPGTHPTQPGTTLMPKVKVGLEVWDPETGETVEQKEMAANLATDNWLEFLGSLLTNGEARRTANMTQKNGNAGTAITWEDGNFNLFNIYGSGRGWRLALGDGGGASVSPSRSNHALVNEVFFSPPVTPEIGTNTLVWSATWSNSTGGTVTLREAGAFLRTSNDQDSGPYLMFHDAVAATDVADGQNATLTYTFEFP